MSSELTITKPLQKITDASEIHRFSSIAAAAFSQDALNRYLYLGRESHPEHPKLEQPELRAKYWEAIIGPRFDSGAILVESHDWAAVALWFPPGVEKKPNPSSTLSEGVVEYLTFYKTLREEKLGSRLHWHLNIICRDPGRPDKGAVRAILEPFLAEAKAKDLPVWLESTNAHAKGIYEHFGFKVVGETRIGKGIVGSDGWAKEGGEGVETWGMIAGLDGCSNNGSTGYETQRPRAILSHFGLIVADVEAAQARFESLDVHIIKRAGELDLSGQTEESRLLGAAWGFADLINEETQKDVAKATPGLEAIGFRTFCVIADPDGNMLEVQQQSGAAI